MKSIALREDLLRPWRHGEHLDAPGTTLDDLLDLSGQRLRGFDLSRAEFRGGLRAQGAEFRGLSWLHGARIGHLLDLGRAVCRFDLRLDAVRCPRVDLTGLAMEGVLRLDDARIGTLVLTDAVLLANLSLARARIDRIEARGLTVMGGLWAEGAAMDRRAFGAAHVEGRV